MATISLTIPDATTSRVVTAIAAQCGYQDTILDNGNPVPNPSTIYLTDNSTTPTGGTWQVSTNGGAGWGNFPLSDKGNETTYIKYTPSSFGSGIKVRAVLSLS